jgi:ribosome biogenesis GTPase
VIAVHRGHLVVAGAQGEALAVVAGRARERATIGDWVVVDARGAVSARLPRHGVLARAGQDLAANVDVAFVVTSANRDLNPRRLERFVAVAAAGGGDTVLVLNKADLVTDLEADAGRRSRAAPGVPTIVASAHRGDGVDAIAATWRGRTGVLLVLGRGKSTLINALLGGDYQATAEIRAFDDRGRHTTSHRAARASPAAPSCLIDTPGLRLPRMSADPVGVAAAFADVEALAAGCRFSDCRHETEPGCAVRAAIAAGEPDPARWGEPGRLADGRIRCWRSIQAPARANLVPVRRALVTCLLVALLGAASAQARVALLATGTNEVALLDVTTDQVVARPPLPGPSRAVAISRDGSRAFAAAGNAVAAFDLGMVPAAALPGTAAPFAVTTRDLGAPAVGIAVSPGGASVYAAAGQRLYVLTPRRWPSATACACTARRALALSREGRWRRSCWPRVASRWWRPARPSCCGG